MKVDVSDILRVNGASLKVDFEEAPPEREPVQGFQLVGTVSFSGSVTNVNGILQLDGRLKTSYRGECYRCLAEVDGKLDLPIKEHFVSSAEAGAENPEMYPFEGKHLNLGKALGDNIILNLPMKQLCSGTCKGLCSKCGANLNEAQCGCIVDDIDPRMEGLSKFFKEV